MKKNVFLVLTILAFVFIITYGYAETEGNLTLLEQGIPGTTSQPFCNVTADCGGDYVCFLDYDGVSNGTSQGWCYWTSYTFCVSDGTPITNGGTECSNSSTVRTCTNKLWSSSTCLSGYTCSSGECRTSDSSDGDGSGGGSGNNDTDDDDNDDTTPPTPISSITITDTINDFDIVQGASVLESVTIQNNGETNLTTASLSMTGIDSDWFSISPSSFDQILILESKTFTINFTVPNDAVVDSYEITLRTAADSVSDSDTFNMRVLPSTETIENTIIPKYENFSSVIADFEVTINNFEAQGKNVTELRGLLDAIKLKLNETNATLTSQDYFAANKLLGEVQTLIDELNVKISELIAAPGKGTDISIFLIAVVILVAVIGVIAFKFWPRGKEYGAGGSIIPSLGGEGKVDRIVEKVKKLKRKKEDEQKFRYEFKRN